jgi:ribosome-associated translation inhibitor RaiA
MHPYRILRHMELRVKGTRYEPTPDVILQAEKQIQSLDKFSEEGARAELELELAVGNKQKGDIWRAELNVITLTSRFRAESTKAKLPHAITTVVRDVGRELRRAKGKDKTLFKRGSKAVKGFLRGFGKQ